MSVPDVQDALEEIFQPPPDTDDGNGERDGYYDRTAIGAVRLEDEGITEFYAINECTMDRCPIFMHCKHLKRERQCQIQVKYLKAVTNIVLANVTTRELTSIQRMKIGFHLQPLYRALCRLKMEELSLRRPTQLTNTGARAMHPVYREIRETIKVITTVLKDLGIDGEKVKEKSDGYYEDLFEEGEKPELKLRKRK